MKKRVTTLTDSDLWMSLFGIGDNSEQDVKSLYNQVAWLFRGLELRANAVANMPYRLIDERENEIEQPEYFRNFSRNLWLIEASLTLLGAGYLYKIREGTNVIYLQYIEPTKVKPKGSVEPTSFEIQVSNRIKQIDVSEIIWFWKPDPKIEFGVPETSPALAAMSAAGVLYNIDEFAKQFFAHGAIKATVLGVPVGTPKTERDRLKSWWNRFMSGVKNAWNTEVINADKISPTIIGEGIKELENTDLTKEKREDIATALGIPHSLLFSNAANYATAVVDDKHFYTKTIIPECRLIEEQINRLLLLEQGYKLEFLPDELEVMQEDENQRAQSLLNLVNAGLSLEIALDVLGYNIDSKQLEQLQQPVSQPTETGQREIMFDELNKWKRKAIRLIKNGKLPVNSFETGLIPFDIQNRINRQLLDVESVEDVVKVFESTKVELSEDSKPKDEALLVDTVNKAIDLYLK